MTREEAIADIERSLSDFKYSGEIIATIHYHELSSISEVISYYYKLWELTEGLTDEYLQRKEGQVMEINPGSKGQHPARGDKVRFNIDLMIESLRNQERDIEAILLALRKRYPRQFPRGNKFAQMTAPKP